MTTVAAAAWVAHRAGLNVLPPKEDGTKAPAAAWKVYQQRRSTDAELSRWYGPHTGLGVVCGAISGNLELFEFDERQTYEDFKQVARDTGLGELVGRLEGGYVEDTPGGGVHWFYRCPEIEGNTELARRPKAAAEMKHADDKVAMLIETRAEGGFAIVAPSNGRVHPTGKPYVLRQGGFASILTINPEERRDLWELARTFDQMPRSWAEEAKRDAASPTGERPGDDFNFRGDWANILEPHGWKGLYQRGGEAYWRRPGKDRGVSATTNYQDNGLLYVFSTSTVFEGLRGYSKFGAFALLEHGGDFSAAAKALAQMGYGKVGDSGYSGFSDSADESTTAADEDAPPRLQVTSFADIPPKAVQWLWPGRFPRGKLSIIAGDPGLAKSFMSLDIAARVSLGGPWPDGQGRAPEGNVLLVSGEDGPADTIRPRLDLLGADVNRIHVIDIIVDQEERQSSFTLAEHLLPLEREIIEHQAVLLVLDPLLAFMGKIDTHRSGDVRLVLAPLAAMADRTGCTVLGIFHLNKRGADTSPMYRLTASLDFAAAARAVFVAGKHPDNPAQFVLATVKTNLSAPPQSLAYHVHDGVFGWEGAVDMDAARLLSTAEVDSNAKADAAEFLVQTLAAGPVPNKDVTEGARANGISERTLERARKDLGVIATRVGQGGKQGGGYWAWSLSDPIKGANPHVTQGGTLNQEGGEGGPTGGLRVPIESEELDINKVKGAKERRMGFGTLNPPDEPPIKGAKDGGEVSEWTH